MKKCLVDLIYKLFKNEMKARAWVELFNEYDDVQIINIKNQLGSIK